MIGSRNALLTLGILTIYLPHYLMKHEWGFPDWWPGSYAGDLLFIPFLCLVCSGVILLVLGPKPARLSWLTVLGLVVSSSWYFEAYIPSKHPSFTADPLDVICYFIGGVAFLIWQHTVGSWRRIEPLVGKPSIE